MAFLVGLAVGFFARSTARRAFPQRDIHAADMAAIEKLHQVDVEATFTEDPSYVPKLWSDDAVNLVFPAPAVGIKAIGEAFQKFWAQYPDFHVLKYTPNIKNIQIADGWALEVIHSEATFKMSAKDDPVSVQTDGIRVLKRQSDGSWKFALVGLK
jgi:ketosteroid isomerase-like protein